MVLFFYSTLLPSPSPAICTQADSAHMVSVLWVFPKTWKEISPAVQTPTTINTSPKAYGTFSPVVYAFPDARAVCLRGTTNSQKREENLGIRQAGETLTSTTSWPMGLSYLKEFQFPHL